MNGHNRSGEQAMAELQGRASPKGLCGLSSEVRALLGRQQVLWKNGKCQGRLGCSVG